MDDDRRLIEDYLPIEAISAEASREKSVRKGHISTLHLWWARRPLVACRAAVYGALVPVSRFVPNGASDEKKKSLGRANAAKFVQRLCRYPSESKPDEKADIDRAIREAQRHILEAHAERLTGETGNKVSAEDIAAGRAPRPKVLDMFAGGGSIPLEALRLGCEAHALDLNPVAHIIELCTLVYPQKYGKPDPDVRGMSGPKNGRGQSTWGGLAEEVRYWGNQILSHVKGEIGDLYPLIPDPEFKGKKTAVQWDWLKDSASNRAQAGYLIPVAYLWTRTVTCKNPHCGASVPLAKQTWLCKKSGRYVALKIIASDANKQVRFEVVEARSENALGFNPEFGSKSGNATCPFCATVADSDYVQAEGCRGQTGQEMTAVVCIRPGQQGKVYLSANEIPTLVPDKASLLKRIQALELRSGLTISTEKISPLRPSPNARGMSAVTRHGMLNFGDLFNARQLLCLLTFAEACKFAHAEMENIGIDPQRATAISTFLGLIVDRLADFNSSLCVLNFTGGRGVGHTFTRHALPMVWDFAETNPFNPDGASWVAGMDDVPEALRDIQIGVPGEVLRGSAVALPLGDLSVDAILTDPPYYDNIPYADVSDFFYVWLKRTIGYLYPEHFASELTPKRAEATALASRHGGDMSAAEREYEGLMSKAFSEARRVLKPGGAIAVVYAHKTTLGWAVLVNALRNAGFTVTEAWPLDTEKRGRLLAQETAALASSILLIGRKRNETRTGKYETEVAPELKEIVQERVATLWDMGVSSADLVIACIGAGLRAFTRFARVEYDNGEEVPAERFLSEVEAVVLDAILERLSKQTGAKGGHHTLSGIDPATRFYVLWRYTYRTATLDAGEAIVFANGTHVELEGPASLSYGPRALVEREKNKYRLRDFSDRGLDESLGISENGQSSCLVDVLHRVLWLMENQPREIGNFLVEAGPNREQLRLVVQALTGPALKGGELSDVSPTGELAVLAKLAANWRSVVDDAVTSAREREDRRLGQRDIFGRG